MRALVLTTDAFGGYGGIAKYNRDLLTALCSYPGSTEVVALPRFMRFPSEDRPAGLTYVTDALDTKLGYVAAVAGQLRRNRRFDLIVCSHINLLPIAHLAQRWIKAPLLMLIYGIEAWRPTFSFFSNYLVRNLTGVVSISAATFERFQSWSGLQGVQPCILPNAVDREQYGPRGKSPVLLAHYGLQGKVVLMTLGRMVSEERFKGFDKTLEALPELVKTIPNVAYLIGGDGPDRPRLLAKAKELQVADRVVFTGYIPEAEKADHYRLADAYVMPSLGEGFGFVFLEAMACGIPVVASRLDGSREAVRDGMLGVLVTPTDPASVRQGILEALSRPRGVVPEGLDYFSFANFERRVHALVDRTLAVHA